MSTSNMRKLMENIQVTEEAFSIEDVLTALQDLLDSTSLQAFSSNKQSAQLNAQKILDSFGVTSSMREVMTEASPPTVHEFDSTGEAYNATQIDKTIKAGDTLVIKNEQVVGVAHTWPIAITQESGNLHVLADGYNKPEDVSDEQMKAAYNIAKQLGFPIRQTNAPMEMNDPMADPDDFGVQDDITSDPHQHLPKDVFYSIKEIPGDEYHGEPDIFLVWRHEGGSSSAVGNPDEIRSMKQAEALIANDAKQAGLGNRYEIEYR